MRDRLTSINLPGCMHSGLADYGRKSVPEMIEQIRSYADEQKRLCEQILAATDTDFCVETYIGVHRRACVETLQVGRASAIRSLGSTGGAEKTAESGNPAPTREHD